MIFIMDIIKEIELWGVQIPNKYIDAHAKKLIYSVTFAGVLDFNHVEPSSCLLTVKSTADIKNRLEFKLIERSKDLDRP